MPPVVFYQEDMDQKTASIMATSLTSLSRHYSYRYYFHSTIERKIYTLKGA